MPKIIRKAIENPSCGILHTAFPPSEFCFFHCRKLEMQAAFPETQVADVETQLANAETQPASQYPVKPK